MIDIFLSVKQVNPEPPSSAVNHNPSPQSETPTVAPFYEANSGMLKVEPIEERAPSSVEAESSFESDGEVKVEEAETIPTRKELASKNAGSHM